MRHLILVLEGPLLAFGGETVDAHGVIVDFPAASLLTGLLANALGWRRSERTALDRLQARLRFAARIDREGRRFTDYQTAHLFEDEKGWTTRGAVEARAKSPSYQREKSGRRALTHQRWRDYDADKRVTVALRLDPAEEAPTVDDLAAALSTPARPLFLGRKPCLPSRPVLESVVEAADFLAALPPAEAPARLLLPDAEPAAEHDERRPISDQRNWRSGVHGGQRMVRIRRVEPG
jgi:CRISPR system Cascade subunit CasD